MVSSIVMVTHTLRVSNKERADFVFDAEVNHLTRGFMPTITDTAFSTSALLVLGALQLPPPTGILLTARLLLSQFTYLLVTLSLETTDTAPCHNHGLPCVCGNGSKVDFPQVYCCMSLARRLRGFLHFHTHMQLKAIIPN